MFHICNLPAGWGPDSVITMLKRFCLLVLLGGGAPVFARDKALDQAPYCAAPNARALFVAPMGEPFRAEHGQPYPSAAWFAQADTNHDGMVDRIEFIADANRFFKTLDRNHDGKLDPDEVVAYERDVAPEIALYGPRTRDVVLPIDRRRLPDGESNYYGPMGAGRYSWLNVPEPIVAADEDVDRMIGEREFSVAAGHRFDMLDPDGHGHILLKDMPKTPMQQTLEGPCKTRPKPKRRPGERGPGIDPRDGLPDTLEDGDRRQGSPRG